MISDSVLFSHGCLVRRPVVGYLNRPEMASNRLCNTSIINPYPLIYYESIYWLLHLTLPALIWITGSLKCKNQQIANHVFDFRIGRLKTLTHAHNFFA